MLHERIPRFLALGVCLLLGAPAASQSAAAGPGCDLQVTITGSCPGPGTFTVTGAQPHATIACLCAFGPGSYVIPAGYPCAGTQLGLDASVFVVAVNTVDANGSFSTSFDFPPGLCGSYCQVLDLSDCCTSEVVEIPSTNQTIICGKVFYDIDEDGVFNPAVTGEVPIEGWKVQLEANGIVSEVFTDAQGDYEFVRNRDSTRYLLRSAAPSPGFIGEVGGRWLATSPAEVSVLANEPKIRVDFGKLFFVNTPEFARSKGYWHYQGEQELLACDPTWRTVINDLCLRTNFSNPNGQAGTLFTVSTGTPFEDAFGELSGYLVSTPSNGVLAYILSVQFCAAHLNRTCGPLQVTTYIDRFGDDILVRFEDMAADTRAILCDPRSADTGPKGDPAWRDVIRGCLDEWSGMNSNGGNVYTRSANPPDFPTPY